MATATKRKKATKKAAAPTEKVKPRDVIQDAMEPLLNDIAAKVVAHIRAALEPMPHTSLKIETHLESSYRSPGCVHAEIRLDHTVRLVTEVSYDYSSRDHRWFDEPYDGKPIYPQSRFVGDQHLHIGRDVLKRYNISSEVNLSMRLGNDSATTLVQANRIAKIAQLGLEMENLIEALLTPSSVGAAVADALAKALEKNGQPTVLARHKSNYTERN